MVRTHGRGWQPNGVRRRLPRTRRRTLRAMGTAHVHSHVRRATGALNEERSTAKTTVCRASGTTTRQTTSARARSSPMRGPDLAQLSRRRTPRIQEEALGGSIAYVASCPVRERRVMATTRASSVCSRVHMVRTYTWPRTETNQRTNQSTNQPVCAVNKDDDIATTTTRPTPNHARHATPTPATPTPRAPRSAENASLLCVFRKRLFLFLHFTSAVVIFFLSLSFSSGSSYRLPSFLFRGSSFFLGLPRVTRTEG